MNISCYVQELLEEQRRNDHILRAQKESLIISIRRANYSSVIG